MHGRKATEARHEHSLRQFAKTAIALCLAVLATLGTARAEELTKPRRIVSIHACADQVLLALADREQIVALSPYATDERLSFLADRARTYRIASGSAEETLQMQPDLVLAGRFTKASTRAILKREGLRVETLAPVRTIADSIAQIRRVAGLIGQSERGETLIGRIEKTTDALRGRFAARHATALLLQRRGYVTGRNSLVGDILRLVGIENVADFGPRPGGQISLEAVLTARPDILIVAKADPDASDQGIALLSHPALMRLYPPSRRLILPERLTVCGGPAQPLALNHIGREAERVLAPRGQ